MSEKEVSDFIIKYDILFEGKLSRFYNYSRVVSLANFNSTICHLGINNQNSVGVISGSESEPELKFLNYDTICFLNFESDASFDLDNNWDDKNSQNFSFTICNQVLEHVFNPHVAFRNILKQTRNGGYVYITIPTINRIHGEPYFYSSGFHPRFLTRLGVENNLEVIDLGWWGSYKYMINAVSGHWLPEKMLRRGIHQFNDVKFPLQIFKDGCKPDVGENEIITDCWALYKKPENNT